jgi:bromodomain-containing factor 1
LELDIEQLSNDALNKLYNLVVKHLPHLPEEYRRRNAPPEPAETSTPASGKPRKNKPMGKNEQEQKIAYLQGIRAQIGVGSQETPMQSIEQDHVASTSQADAAPAAQEDSDEESSEEE